ncbi:ERI1 exoribonuclease 3-like isoform X1 [Centruroides vittatus]|uniref:ERI1 exoribonuclease 3-like isoform X1 n=1 Tax=Centruroides vittatus TaxID=120091 RepID=UPI00350F1907
MIFTSALRCKHSLNLLQRIFQNSKNKISKRPQQIFDYFLVTDFEATCNEKRNVLKPQEIIEFPVLKVDGKNFEIQSVFHEYVQPVVHKELHPFCIELTGIIQDMVDGQPHFDEILKKFQGWMESENLLNPEIKFAFVTYSDFDFNKMLPSQCKFLGIDVPSYMTEWIDIQKCFADETTQWPNLGLKGVLDYLNITPVGRLHSGIDDCRNTIAIMKALADRGYVFKINSTFSRKKGGEGKKNS